MISDPTFDAVIQVYGRSKQPKTRRFETLGFRLNQYSNGVRPFKNDDGERLRNYTMVLMASAQKLRGSFA